MFLKILEKILAYLAKKIIKKQKPIVIGITGSVGKSSTKEAIGLVLSQKFKTRTSKGNYNNEIGVPLTIIGKDSPGKNIIGWINILLNGFLKIVFKQKSYPEILVLEMAADRPGDIKYLTEIIPCDIGVLTAISPAHTAFFKDIQGIIKEKKNIITHLSFEDTAILNADDENVLNLQRKTKAKLLTYGISNKAMIKATEIEIDQDLHDDWTEIKGLKFKVVYQGNVVPVFLPKVISFAQVYSVLAAFAVGINFNINLLEIVQSFKEFKPLLGRLNVLKGKNNSLILDDTYNSSPKAVEIALSTAQKIKIPFQSMKWAILGDMLELGALSKKAHFQVGEQIKQADFDYLITVGQEAKEIAQGARKEGLANERIFSFRYPLGVAEFLEKRIKTGDLILVKGSQGVRMEKIVKQIMLKPNLAKKHLVRQSRKWLKV